MSGYMIPTGEMAEILQNLEFSSDKMDYEIQVHEDEIERFFNNKIMLSLVKFKYETITREVTTFGILLTVSLTDLVSISRVFYIGGTTMIIIERKSTSSINIILVE